MKEAEWQACTAPQPMLEYLRGKVSDRKLRLFGCACCRRVWSLLSRKSRKSLVIAERYSDGEVSGSELFLAYFRAGLKAKVENRRDETAEGTAMSAVAWVCDPPMFDSLSMAVEMGVELAAASESYPIDPDRLADARRKQVSPLRCIFGNPFHPVSLNPSWQTSAMTGSADCIYKERRFQDLPKLADYLEDMGCTNEDILNHCRKPNEHVRGCWVVDLILGKK